MNRTRISVDLDTSAVISEATLPYADQVGFWDSSSTVTLFVRDTSKARELAAALVRSADMLDAAAPVESA